MLKSKVWMAKGPVLHQRKQSSCVLRPNWNAVQWPRVFGINMTSHASRRRYQSSVRPKWWERRGHLHWTHRGIPLRLAENIRVGEARIFCLFTTGSEVCCGAGRPSRWRQIRNFQCAHHSDVPSQKFPGLLARVSVLCHPAFCHPVWSNPPVPL